MIYPNTQPSGIAGGNDNNNKQKLQQYLSALHSMPLFGSSGRSASVASLPSVGSPALSFNPFLRMLAGHPGETFQDFGNQDPGSYAAGIDPTQGFVGSSVPTAGPSSGGGQAAPAQIGQGVPSQPAAAAPNTAYSTGYGHYFDGYLPGGSSPATTAPAPAPAAGGGNTAGFGGVNFMGDAPASMYHTLLQLAMYGNQ